MFRVASFMDTCRNAVSFPAFEGLSIIALTMWGSLNSSSSLMAPLFANQSCDPFTSESSACKLGNYVSYAINVTCVDDIVAGVQFASKHDVRFVIRNTGHE